MWEIMYPHSPIQHELYGVRLDFLKPYTGKLYTKNIYSRPEDVPLAREVFEQYIKDKVIETRPFTNITDTWLKAK